jgi:hypothetical protein
VRPLRGRPVRVDAAGLAGLGYDDVGFGVFADVIVDSEVLLSYRNRWLGPARGCTMQGATGSKNADMVREAIGRDAATLRLRSDPEWALLVLDAKRIWKGEIELPLVKSATPTGVLPPPPKQLPAR